MSAGSGDPSNLTSDTSPRQFPIWFGPDPCPLRGWIHEPADQQGTNVQPAHEGSDHADTILQLERAKRAVIIVPGFGYEEFVLAFGLRLLSAQLAAHGIRVLRYDHPGTGDSADPNEPADGSGNDLDRWTLGVHEACQAINADHITLLGVRLGASIAMLAASKVPVDRLVLWEPVVSGRRLVRELTLLNATSNANRSQPENDSDDERTLVVGGFVVPMTLKDNLRSLDLKKIANKPSREALIIGSSQRPADASLVLHLSALGTVVTSIEVAGSDEWLERSSELALSPTDGFAKIITHIISKTDTQNVSIAAPQNISPTSEASGSRSPANKMSYAQTLSSSRVLFGHAAIRETAMQLGIPRLSAVLTQPLGALIVRGQHLEREPLAKDTETQGTTAVLLCNSGVERNTGPGRAWVPLARRWASEGRTVLRIDLSGVGNSECWPGQRPFQTYCPENLRDIALGIDELKALGHHRAVIVGLCASAFSALQSSPIPEVVGVASINVQLYRAGTEAGNETINPVVPATNYRKYRLAKIDERIGARRKAAWFAELAGRGHISTQWMQRWTASGTRLLLLFGGDDRGLRYLLWRAPLGLQRLRRSQRFHLEVLADLDHALHAPGPRSRAVQRIVDFVATFDAPSPT